MYAQVFQLHQDTFKALANSRRLEIVHLLRDQSLNVGQIQSMLGLPQANLSQHLQILRDALLVESERKGKEIYYRVSDKRLVQACDLVREVLIDRHKSEPVADELTMKMQDLVPVVCDPVCGMRLSPKTAGFGYRHGDHDYFFCASGCLNEFKKNPQKFLDH